MGKIEITITIVENMFVSAEIHVTDTTGKNRVIVNLKNPLITVLKHFFRKFMNSQEHATTGFPKPSQALVWCNSSNIEQVQPSSRVKQDITLPAEEVPLNFEAELSDEGVNGTYFIKEKDLGKMLGIFKPQDEEASAKHSPKKDQDSNPVQGILPEEAAVREIAAYLLDKDGFYGVPSTFLATLSHTSFYDPERGADQIKTKTGSYQQFVAHDCSSWDMGPAGFPVDEVHKIGILDVQILNIDRHGGNILIQKNKDGLKLIPIDHGYSLPDKLGNSIWFEWMNWEQSRVPFSQQSKAHVASIDLEANIQMLQQDLSIRPECLKMMRVSTTLLKKAVANNLTLYDIGSIVCRTKSPDQPSVLEEMCHQAEAQSDGDDQVFFKILFPLMDEAIVRS